MQIGWIRMESIYEPTSRISKQAIKVWRLSNLITDVIGIIIIGALLWAGIYFDWFQWIITILWILLGVAPLFSIWSVFFEPSLLYKYWRYGMDEEYVRLKYGIFNRKHTVIPMTKIQYVSAEQGPILRKYGLYTIEIGSTGSSHEIPALSEEEAFLLRDQIAHHAKIKEVE